MERTEAGHGAGRRQAAMWVMLAALLAAGPVGAARLWWDGTVDSATTAPGRLLSDNAGYWGDCVLTGVRYTYPVQPQSPADVPDSALTAGGGRLLDGHPDTGVGLAAGQPLVVELDFGRRCIFTEWDIVTATRQVGLHLQLRQTADAPWESAYTGDLLACPDRAMHRVELPRRPQGRFARLVVSSAGLTRLDEVVAWGESADETPERIEPVAQGQHPVGVAYPTLTGVASTVVSDRESFAWVQSLPPVRRQQPAVWAALPTWGSLSRTPVQPPAAAVNQPLQLVMARNETETLALALRNTWVDSPRQVQVQWTPPVDPGAPGQTLEATVGVFGIIGDRAFGNAPGPILSADNLPGASLLRRYLLNGDEVAGFPHLNLPPSGAAVLWLRVTSRDARPGTYRGTLQVSSGQAVPYTVEVVDVALPMVFAHVKTYCDNRTPMFPFVYGDREEREVGYALDCGISDWTGGATERRLAAARGMRLLHDLGLLLPFWSDPAPDYVGMIWQGRWTKAADFPADAAGQVAAKVRKVVARAASLGLDYPEWYGTMPDEPGAANMGAVAAMCGLIRQSDPRVQVYVNPCYWTGYDQDGVAPDSTVAAGLKGAGSTRDWYRRWVSVSAPLALLLRNRPNAAAEFAAPRAVNSYYWVSGQLGRADDGREVELYRRMAWDSFAAGFNGWAFYAYYSPRGNPWNHFDQDGREPSDYQIVYPGPRGVIPTRQSEALREGWEDWRLLHLLRQQAQEDELARLVAAYQTGQPLAELRLEALRAAARGVGAR